MGASAILLAYTRPSSVVGMRQPPRSKVESMDLQRAWKQPRTGLSWAENARPSGSKPIRRDFGSPHCRRCLHLPASASAPRRSQLTGPYIEVLERSDLKTLKHWVQQFQSFLQIQKSLFSNKLTLHTKILELWFPSPFKRTNLTLKVSVPQQQRWTVETR